MRKASTIIFGTLFLVLVGCFLFSLHNFLIYPYWEDKGVIEFMSPEEQWETAAFSGILLPASSRFQHVSWPWERNGCGCTLKPKNISGLGKVISR